MHTTIDYGNFVDNEAKHKQAIADIKEFWGLPAYEGLTRGFLEKEKVPKRTFISAMSFAGVQGYPAHALYKELWPDAEDA